MPSTVIGLLIFLIAVLPGLPGYKIYDLLIGRDWREKEWERIANILSFSLAGLLLYMLVASFLKLPSPVHIFPSTYDSANLNSAIVPDFAVSLLGHFSGSIIVGVIAAIGARLISRHTKISPHPSAWDEFARAHVPNHWVIIRLSSGDAYGGMLMIVDTSVDRSERDVILGEPAVYDDEKRNYKSLPYQSIFIPADMISSIAVVHDPESDKRVTEIGQNLFKE